MLPSWLLPAALPEHRVKRIERHVIEDGPDLSISRRPYSMTADAIRQRQRALQRINSAPAEEKREAAQRAVQARWHRYKIPTL